MSENWIGFVSDSWQNVFNVFKCSSETGWDAEQTQEATLGWRGSLTGYRNTLTHVVLFCRLLTDISDSKPQTAVAASASFHKAARTNRFRVSHMTRLLGLCPDNTHSSELQPRDGRRQRGIDRISFFNSLTRHEYKHPKVQEPFCLFVSTQLPRSPPGGCLENTTQGEKDISLLFIFFADSLTRLTNFRSLFVRVQKRRMMWLTAQKVQTVDTFGREQLMIDHCFSTYVTFTQFGSYFIHVSLEQPMLNLLFFVNTFVASTYKIASAGYRAHTDLQLCARVFPAVGVMRRSDLFRGVYDSRISPA